MDVVTKSLTDLLLTRTQNEQPQQHRLIPLPQTKLSAQAGADPKLPDSDALLRQRRWISE